MFTRKVISDICQRAMNKNPDWKKVQHIHYECEKQMRVEICRKYNLKPNVFYSWKQKFIEGGKLALTGSGQNINKQIHAENERLKKLIGELTIANDAFKKTLET